MKELAKDIMITDIEKISNGYLLKGPFGTKAVLIDYQEDPKPKLMKEIVDRFIESLESNLDRHLDLNTDLKVKVDFRIDGNFESMDDWRENHNKAVQV